MSEEALTTLDDEFVPALEIETKEVFHSESLPSYQPERETVPATELYGKTEVRKRIKRRQARAYAEEHLDDYPFPAEELAIDTFDLTEQDLTAADLEKQATELVNTPLLEKIKDLSENNRRHIVKKLIMRMTMEFARWLQDRDGIVLRHGSPAEVALAWQTFLREWPPGINLYDVLQHAYPAYHHQMVGSVPVYLAQSEKMNELIEKGVDESTITGPFKYTAKNGRFIGLYPLIEVPREEITAESQWRSQDQLGRVELSNRMIENMQEYRTLHHDEPILVVDYAGGVGNATEVLINQIAAIEDNALREELQNNVRFVVRELAEGQITGGRARFEQIVQKHPWIQNRVCFVQSDITEPVDERQQSEMQAMFGEDFDYTKQHIFGMTSYTAGALPGFVVEKMAERVEDECTYFSAIDFSSPMWNEQAFIEQTGDYGREYLRTIHGVADKDDSRLVKQWVSAMKLAPGLADHYNETWPGEWGHNSGYGIRDDGTLRKPSVLELADALQKGGMNVGHKFTTNAFSFIPVGKSGEDEYTLAVVPGWVRSDIEMKQFDKSTANNEI